MSVHDAALQLFFGWALAFSLTLLIEFPVYTWLLPGRRMAIDSFRLVLGVNLVTHPTLSLLILFLGRSPAVVLPAELMATLVEGVLLGRVLGNPRCCLAVALAANALSFGLGWIFFG